LPEWGGENKGDQLFALLSKRRRGGTLRTREAPGKGAVRKEENRGSLPRRGSFGLTEKENPERRRKGSGKEGA